MPTHSSTNSERPTAGRGRALGGEIKFTGQVTDDVKLVEYGIDLKRVMKGRLTLGIADGWVKADGKVIYEAKDLRVGLFTDNQMMAQKSA